jgi:hypothetical protein
MRFALGVLSLLVAVAVRADSLGDLKTAVASLKGAAPLRAAVELQRTEVDRSKKPPETQSGGAAVEAVVDAEGLHVMYAPALLVRVAKEQADREANSDRQAPTVDAVAALGPLPITEHLDFGRRLLGVLNRAELVSEKRVVLEGRSARLLALKIKNLPPKTSIGHVEILEDSLNVWVGDDNVPFAAHRTSRYSAGIMFLKVEGAQITRWNFLRKDDRLVATRTEEKSTLSGFGQNRDETEITSVVVR